MRVIRPNIQSKSIVRRFRFQRIQLQAGPLKALTSLNNKSDKGWVAQLAGSPAYHPDAQRSIPGHATIPMFPCVLFFQLHGPRLPACLGSPSQCVGFLFPLVWVLLGSIPLGWGTEQLHGRYKMLSVKYYLLYLGGHAGTSYKIPL